MAVLVLADHDQGSLAPATAHVIAAAGMLSPQIDILVAGADIARVATQAAAISGVAKVRVAEDESLAHDPAEALTDLLQSLSTDYTHVIASAASVGRDVLPRLAARLDVMPITDIVAIRSPLSFDRPVYAGNAVQTVSTSQTLNLLTVRASAFPGAAAQGNAEIVPVTLSKKPDRTVFGRELRTQNDSPDLVTARIVVGGGVALSSAENFGLIEDLARLLGAAIGATRAAVDAGFAPNDWQIGQTGKIIAPDLYVAIGISGALQHLAGIQGAKKIIAINTDPEAPLMKIADYAYVGDLFEVVPALIAALGKSD